MTYGHLGIQYGTTRLAFSQFSRAASGSAVTRLCRCSWGGQPSVVAMWAAFYIREVPERGMVATTSAPLSLVPQVAPATAAAGSRFLPAQWRGGPRWGLARPHRGRRAGPLPPRISDPYRSLVGPSQRFLCALNGSVGQDPNCKRKGTQE